MAGPNSVLPLTPQAIKSLSGALHKRLDKAINTCTVAMLEETAASEYNCDGELEDATQAVYGALDKWWKWVSLCGGRSNFTTCARKLTNAINGEAMCVDGVNESQLKLLNQVVNVIGLVTDVLTAVKASREEPR